MWDWSFRENKEKEQKIIIKRGGNNSKKGKVIILLIVMQTTKVFSKTTKLTIILSIGKLKPIVWKELAKKRFTGLSNRR